MQKKPLFVVAATLLLTSTVSLAQLRSHPPYPPQDYKAEKIVTRVPCCVSIPNSLRDGLYIGAGLGYDSYRIRQSINVLDASGILDQANPALSGRGLVGDVLGGYGQYFEWFYIAGEIFTKYTSTHSGYSLNAYNSDFAVRETYGFSIIPGVRLNRTALLYVRLGYARTFLKAQENGTALGNFESSNWGNGIDLGLGAEMAVYRNFSVRGEYVYTDYSSFRSNALNTKFITSNSEFIVSLLYHFCL